MPRYPRRPAPEPLDTNATPVVLIGTALWGIAGLVLLLRHPRIPGAHGWLLWTCLAGLIIGAALYGYEHHRRAQRRAQVRKAADD